LFTSIIEAIVAPRKTSSDISRPLPVERGLPGTGLLKVCNEDSL
jgi:hypothetical protein